MSDERYDALINQNQTQNLAAATSFVGLWDVDTNDDAHKFDRRPAAAQLWVAYVQTLKK